jgi:acyl-CoA synthetase (AMP-forming)/AMP-acid ligase II
MIEFGPSMAEAYLGALLGGFVPSFMPYSAAKQEPEEFVRSHRLLFERIGAAAVATNRDWLDDNSAIFSGSSVKALLSDEVYQNYENRSQEEPYQAGAEEIALLQHSSGTTALKKGVALSHRAVLNQARSYAKAIKLGPQDLVASWLPLYHDMGLMACFLIPLILGAPVAQVDPFLWAREPWRLFEMIGRHRATLVWLPNFAYHHLVRNVDPQQPHDLSSVRAFVDCSEPCKPSTMRAFLEAFGRSGVRPEALQACYAMAENCFAVTQTVPGQLPRHLSADADRLSREGLLAPPAPGARAVELMSTGRPIVGAQVRVVDATRKDLPEGVVGEIAVTGDSLFSGYLKLPDETAASLHEGWYYTGDLGLLDKGELYITGRKKDLIIVRGRNFYAHEIEHLVAGVPGVKPGRAVAFGVYRDESGTEDAIVVAETTDSADLDDKAQSRRAVDVKRRVKAALDLDLYSVKLVAPGWLVKTTSGKISRSENKQKYLSKQTVSELAEGQAGVG